MKTTSFFLVLLVIFSSTLENVFAQEKDTTKEFTNYRRIDLGNLPSPEKYAQPKEQVFPLGYRTKHLTKVTSSTGIWTELNPGVPRVDYVGIDFINPDTGWACGGSGAIIKTINGGDDWTISETPVTNLLLKIHSYNGQVVIATGYDGIILRSSDGGDTFEQVVSGVGNGMDLWGLEIINDTLGWACGLNQTLLKTTDAGLSWQVITPGLNQHYWSLDFLNEQYGMIACGGGIVLRTTDGGDSWTQTQAGDTRALYTIDIIEDSVFRRVDSLHIAVGGDTGKNCYSSNGGLTWTQNNNLIFSEVNCIAFVDADTGYTIGELWGIKKTTNRGVSWFSEGNNICEWWIDLLPDGDGYSVGDALKIYKTESGYDNWVNLFFNINLADVYFTDELTGYVAGGTWIGGPVYKTTDGGLSWFGLPNFPLNLFTSTLTSIIFTDSVTGFAGGAPFRIAKTTDAGDTWRRANMIGVTDTLGQITKIFFLNQTIGWAVTSFRGTILKTTDGGDNWLAQLITFGGYGFTSINFVDSLYGWVSGGRAFKTTDGGQTWIEQSNSTLWNSDDVYFINQDSGWFAKYSSINNSLFSTTDGGISWIGIPQVIGARKFYFFPDPVHWLTIGFSRYYITNDYGSNWLEFTEDVPTGFNSFSAVTDKLGYAVGTVGLILRYDDTTYVPVELISFEGFVEENQVVLKWKTASELNNLGFVIEKSLDRNLWRKIGFVEGNGTTTEQHIYKYSDIKLHSGTHYYRLKQMDFDGRFEYSTIIEIKINVPIEYNLSQNYPNPFNSSTIINYKIPKEEYVTLVIYDLLGNKVSELVNEKQKAGRYEVIYSPNKLSSGTYFYKISAGGFYEVRKFVLLK